MFFECRPKRTTKQKEELCTWGHRYLRLHKELLADCFCAYMYQKFRLVLIEKLRKKLGGYGKTQEEFGAFVDSLADMYNSEHAQEVHKFTFVLEMLREVCAQNLSFLEW
ncbi:MAG: hypothetical protein J6U60_01535 [Clostridia bacterium]|nr:hypothetical protein [Clostridia bacterium]